MTQLIQILVVCLQRDNYIFCFFLFKANYTDPLTKLRFSDASEFYRVRDLPMDIVNGLLELRKANSIVGWKHTIFDLKEHSSEVLYKVHCCYQVFMKMLVSTSSHEAKIVGQYRLWYFSRTLEYLILLSWKCHHKWDNRIGPHGSHVLFVYWQFYNGLVWQKVKGSAW